MPEKMNVADFQNLVCDLWIKEGEKAMQTSNKNADYGKITQAL